MPDVYEQRVCPEDAECIASVDYVMPEAMADDDADDEDDEDNDEDLDDEDDDGDDGDSSISTVSVSPAPQLEPQVPPSAEKLPTSSGQRARSAIPAVARCCADSVGGGFRRAARAERDRD